MYPLFATLGPSWNLSLAESLESLSLQDGPQSGIIFRIVTHPPHPPTHPSHRISLWEPFLRNYLPDLPHLLNLSLRDQTKILNCFKWRRPPAEDDLKILKVSYLHNHCSGIPNIFNLVSGDQTKIKKEDDLKILKV